MKYFIITVDTEGDNLWNYKKGQEVKTENTLFIPRFQNLCEKYGFKPVWLTNYEMACDQRYVDYIKPKMEAGLCEVGIHVHAWNNPPLYKLNAKYTGNPYLIEYPDEVMWAKFETTYNLLKDKFGIEVKSHRSGRWAMDDRYFALLKDFGIEADCSHTPGVSWAHAAGETMMGSDYSAVQNNPSFINNILEIPMTIRRTHISRKGSVKHKLRVLLQGDNVWLRPASATADEMLRLCKCVNADPDVDYLEFMLHSSELMPNGSPYFKDENAIEELYITIEKVFAYAKQLGYEGITMAQYCKAYKNRNR